MDLNQDGVRLYFDPKSQRLKVTCHVHVPLPAYSHPSLQRYLLVTYTSFLYSWLKYMMSPKWNSSTGECSDSLLQLWSLCSADYIHACSNRHFCSPEITPTVDQINHSFGPTHPGGYCHKKYHLKEFMLQFIVQLVMLLYLSQKWIKVGTTTCSISEVFSLPSRSGLLRYVLHVRVPRHSSIHATCTPLNNIYIQ